MRRSIQPEEVSSPVYNVYADMASTPECPATAANSATQSSSTAQCNDEPPADCRRFYVLAVFATILLLNTVQINNYSAITDQSRDFHGATESELSFLASLFMIVFVIGGPFAFEFDHVFGLRRAIVLASLLNALGSSLKLVCVLTRSGFWGLVGAQLVSACAQLPVLGAVPRLSAFWFPPSERTVATAVSCAGINIGGGLGVMLPALFISDSDRLQFMTFFGLQAGIAAAVALAAAFVPPAPRGGAILDAAQELETGADASARMQSHHQSVYSSSDTAEDGALAAATTRADSGGLGARIGAYMVESVRVTIAMLRSSTTFTWLVVAYSLSMGGLWTVAALLPQDLAARGISGEQAGTFLFIGICGGVLLSSLTSHLVDRHRIYAKPAMAALAVATAMLAAAALGMFFVPDGADVPVIGASIVTMSAAATIYVPIALEFAAEITFPNDEALAGGVMMLGANAFGFCGISIFQQILGSDPSRDRAAGTVLALTLVYLAAFAIQATLPDLRRRLAHELRQSSANSEAA